MAETIEDYSGAYGELRERLNSDAQAYGGTGLGNEGGREAEPVPAHDQPWSVRLVLPPLGALFLHQPSPSAPAIDASEASSSQAAVVPRGDARGDASQRGDGY